MSFHLTVEYDQELPSSKEGGEADRCIKIEVSRLYTVNEISQSVYGILKSKLSKELSNYGLFWTEKKVWLRHNRPIGRELKGLNQAYLIYRLKERPVTIRFLDASSETLIVDESLPVKQLVTDICKQLKIDHPEQLSLVVAVDYVVDKHHPVSGKGEIKSPLVNPKKDINSVNGDVAGWSPRLLARRKPGSRPGSAGMFGRVRSGSGTSAASAQIKKQISRKHQIRIDIPWLDPNKSLKEQDVSDEDELLLMYRFHYHMELDRNSTAVEMLYKQARATFLAREMLCTSEEDIPRFTAILCQITYGDYVSKDDTQEKLHKLKKVLLPAKLKSKPFVKEVGAFHLLLNGLDAQEAKCWFVKQWSSMKLFGTEFFSCTNWETKEKGLIGVSKDEIVFLHHNTKKKNLKLSMNSLSSWKLDDESNVVALVVTQEGVQMKLMLHFPAFYSSIFVDCLQGNRDISSNVPKIHLAQKEFQFDEELEKHYTRYSQPSLIHPDLQRLGQRKHKRTGSLTLNDVLYWSDAIETPLVSQEERSSWKTESWENPAFENLDQLMDERFSFLDFDNQQKPTITVSSVKTTSHLVSTSSSPESSPSTERLSAINLTTTSLSPQLDSKLNVKNPLQRQQSPLVYTKVTHQPLTVNDIDSAGSSNNSENASPMLSNSKMKLSENDIDSS